MINQIKNEIFIYSKFLDQKALVKKLNQNMPQVLTGAAGLLWAYDTFKKRDEEKNLSKEDINCNQAKRGIKNFCILSLTVISALIATKGVKIYGNKVFNGLIHSEEAHNHVKSALSHAHKHCPQEQIHHVEKLLKNSKMPEMIKNNGLKLIEKIENNKILSPKEIKEINNTLKSINNDKNLIDKLIPLPHSHNPLSEVGKLSLLGLVPVGAGIAGGWLGDNLSGETKNKTKENLKNSLKEGTYQYLANIVLCNVGAGVGLMTANALNIKNRGLKALSMISGIMLTGVFGGSYIANKLSKEIINPLIDKKTPMVKQPNKTNDERHPEALDICLHIDDFASVGFLSGLKWIGPVLPMLYSISGYRTGIGYRNGHNHEKKHH